MNCDLSLVICKNFRSVVRDQPRLSNLGTVACPLPHAAMDRGGQGATDDPAEVPMKSDAGYLYTSIGETCIMINFSRV